VVWGDTTDIVGLSPDDDRVLLAEREWTIEPVGHSLAASLREKTELVRRTEHARGRIHRLLEESIRRWTRRRAR